MKHILIVLISAICYTASAFAGIDSADRAYSQKRYQDAIRLYESQFEQGTSSELYYNLGCCHYKMQDVPKAILCFERALMLDPSNDDARANLSFVRKKSKIEESAPGSFVSNVLKSSVGKLSSNAWALIAAGVFVLILLAIAAYIFLNSIMWRKVGFFSAGVLLLVFAATIACAFYQRSVVLSHSQAIVMKADAILSTAPHAPSEKEEAYKLKAGIKVNIVDSVNTNPEKKEIWYKVEAPAKQEAWISGADIEKI